MKCLPSTSILVLILCCMFDIFHDEVEVSELCLVIPVHVHTITTSKHPLCMYSCSYVQLNLQRFAIVQIWNEMNCLAYLKCNIELQKIIEETILYHLVVNCSCIMSLCIHVCKTCLHYWPVYKFVCNLCLSL